MKAVEAITACLADTREVNGGELESVLTIYRPGGLAILVMEALAAAGYRVVKMPPEPPPPGSSGGGAS